MLQLPFMHIKTVSTLAACLVAAPGSPAEAAAQRWKANSAIA